MRESTPSSTTTRWSTPRVDLLLRRTRYLDALRGRHVHPNLLPDETLLRRRPLYFAAALLVLLSLLSHQPLLFIAGLLVGALAFLPEVWYRWGLSALVIERRLTSSRAQFGDAVQVTLTLENRKPLPLPWLRIEDEFPEQLPAEGPPARPRAAEGRVALRHTLALWAYQRVRRRYTIYAVARGAYRLGPMTLRTTDPFGILQREADREKAALLLVHPLVAPLEGFGLPPNAPFGERHAPRRLLEDPLRVAGTRAYMPGDEPRRIHWKATARAGALQCKVYDPATRHTLILLLDVRTLSRALMSYDPALVELAVSAAASVAAWAYERRYAVGLYANGPLNAPELDVPELNARAAEDTEHLSEEERVQRAIARQASGLRLRIAPSARPEQLTRILDGLARLQPYYGLPMERVITAEQHGVPFGATIVYIGTQALVDVPLIMALRQLKQRGHAVTLLLTKSGLADAPDASFSLQLAGLPTYTIGSRELWEELVSDVLDPEIGRRTRAARSQWVARLDDEAQSDRAAGERTEQKGAPDGGTGTAAMESGRPRRPRALVVE